MKFLFFTDTHIRGTSPRNRKDNFYETLKKKFENVRQIAEENQVDYILHGGDWFDRPDISPAVVRDFAVIIKSFGRTIYSVAGNHDLYGCNPDTISRTMLGLLDGVDILYILKNQEKIILEDSETRVQLTGSSYNYDLDGENYRQYYIVKKDSNVDFAINLVHGMLLDKPFVEGVNYTLLENIFETEADITLTGHYHSGFGVKKIGAKYFINPGSLVRIANTISELSRRPKVILMSLSKTINIKEVYLSSAPPGEEVFDRAFAEAQKNKKLQLEEFYNTLAGSRDDGVVDLNSIIERIAGSSGVSHEIRAEAIRRIEAAKESLFLGDDEV